MKLQVTLHTDGRGYWTRKAAPIRVTHLGLGYVAQDRSFAELRVYFNVRDWDTVASGLVVTDDLFLKGLRESLIIEGFSDDAVASVDYSEQGMQGDDYVSFDAGSAFMAEYATISTETGQEIEAAWSQYHTSAVA